MHPSSSSSSSSNEWGKLQSPSVSSQLNYNTNHNKDKIAHLGYLKNFESEESAMNSKGKDEESKEGREEGKVGKESRYWLLSRTNAVDNQETSLRGQNKQIGLKVGLFKPSFAFGPLQHNTKHDRYSIIYRKGGS